MLRKLFTIDEEKRVSNTLAGIALLATLIALRSYLEPNGPYEYVRNLIIAIIAGGLVYILAEFVRKRSTK